LYLTTSFGSCSRISLLAFPQHCTFVRVYPSYGDYNDGLDVGFFSRGAYDGDNRYSCDAIPPGDDVGAALKGGRAFGILGWMAHTLALFMVVAIEGCVTWRKQLIWNICRGLVISSAVCSVLIFSVFADEDCTEGETIECAPGPSGIIAVINITILMTASVVSYLTDVPNQPFLYVRRWMEGDGGAVGAQKVCFNSSGAAKKPVMNDEPAGKISSPIAVEEDTTANSHTDHPREPPGDSVLDV